MINRILLSLTPLTLCILMGCPPTQNNEDPSTEDMTSGREDMPETMEDMGKDMPSDREDMPQDMRSVDIEPPVLVQKPASTPTNMATPLTFVLSSVTPLPRRKWTHVAVANGKPRVLEDGEIDFECVGESDEFMCTVTLAPQPPPEGDEAWSTGVHTLTLSNEDGSDTFDIPMHVHLPWEDIKAQDARPASLPLPAHYARCGVAAKVKALDMGTGVFSVMLNETGDKITLDLSVDGLSDPIAVQTVGIMSEDIFAHDLEVIRTPDGGFSAAWWAYDDTHHTFCGVTDHFQSTGVSEGRGDVFCIASPLPITRIIDTQWSLQQDVMGEYSSSVRIMAITENNTWVSLRLFGSDQQIKQESDQEDLFIELPANQISNKNTGFLSINPADVGPEGPTKVWQVSPREPESGGTSQTGVRFTVLSFTDAGQGTASIELPTTFEVKESYVGHSNTGKIFVLLLGEQAEQILYETELNASNELLIPPVEKKLPANVGIEHRRQQALDRRRREARLKRQVRKTRQGFAPHRIELISTGDQTMALGRWPWNWRDRLKSNAITHTMQDVIEGPIEVSDDILHEVPLSVSWVDGESDMKLVAPLVSQFRALGEEPQDIKNTQGALCMSGDGNRVVTQNAAFDPTFCELNEDACRVRIDGFDGGHDIVVGPGQTGVTVSTSLYGEILISGDPIEFDEDRFHDPTPVNNTLHISYEDNLIFEEPFEGPPPLETTIMMAAMNSSDSGATHGVWIRNWQTGKVSGPGEVRFDKGVQSIADGRIQNLTFSGGNGASDVVITAVIDVTYANADTQATFEQPERYIVQIPNDKLIESVKSDQVMVIDLSVRPPLKQAPITRDPYAIASGPKLLSPPLAGRNLAYEAFYGEEVIDLTDEQARAPMLISTSGDGCGSFKIQSVSTDTEGAVALTTLAEHIPIQEDCADQEILLGTGDFTGNGDDTEMLTLNRVQRRLRVRRRIRKRIAGTSDRPKLGLASKDTNLPAEVELGDLEASMGTVVDDFNGDFIDDVAITTGSTSEQPNSTLILFGDGTGGFLSETVQASTPPVRRGVTETAGEVCIGVYNATTNEWKCEDEALKTRNSTLYCGETDHF